MVIVVISSLSEKKFKADNKNVYSSAQFCLGSISGKLQHVKSEELIFKGNVYDFSDNYKTIDKSDLLNIFKYLIVKNNKKMVFRLIKKMFITLLSFSESLAQVAKVSNHTKRISLKMNHVLLDLLLLISVQMNFIIIYL